MFKRIDKAVSAWVDNNPRKAITLFAVFVIVSVGTLFTIAGIQIAKQSRQAEKVEQQIVTNCKQNDGFLVHFSDTQLVCLSKDIVVDGQQARVR